MAAPSDSHDDAVNSRQSLAARPGRRTKVAFACSECRLRKVKCDGVYPTCAPCRRRGDNGCHYPIEQNRKRGFGNCVASLEKRLRYLERATGGAGLQSANLRASARLELATDEIDASEGAAAATHGHMNDLQTQTRSERPNLPSHNYFWPPVAATGTSNTRSANLFDPKEAIASRFHSMPNLDSAQANRSLRWDSNSFNKGVASHENEGVTGINSMMGAVEEDASDPGFFGSSSAASFVQQIKTAVDLEASSQGNDAVTPSKWSDRPLKLTSTRRNVHQSIDAIHFLPPRKIADNLMGIYWIVVFPLYPYMDQDLVRANYSKIWTGETLESDETLFMGMLNVIFALSCQIAEFIKAEERQNSANVFFSRARELLQFALWETASTDLIQCLLLMGQYLQSTDSAHQCWIVIGTAIRNAQSLGLHLPGTISRLQSFREQQIASRIWKGCVLMDRIVAMTFGRPAMVSKASSKLARSPIRASEGLADAEQHRIEPLMMAFFTVSLELYEIAHDILLRLYGSPVYQSPHPVSEFLGEGEGTERLQALWEYDHALDSWLQALPPHLRRSSQEHLADPVFTRQAFVLELRFLHVRLLLFRPMLMAYLTGRPSQLSDPHVSSNEGLQEKMAFHCATTCIKLSQDIIELIHTNVPDDQSVGLLPAWWYNALYAFTAATALIAGQFHDKILAEFTLPELSRSWDWALDILERYQDYSPSVSRHLRVLKTVHDIALSRAAAPKMPPGDQLRQYAQLPVPDGFNTPLGAGSISGMFDNSLDLSFFQDLSWLQSGSSNLP